MSVDGPLGKFEESEYKNRKRLYKTENLFLQSREGFVPASLLHVHTKFHEVIILGIDASGVEGNCHPCVAFPIVNMILAH